MPQRMGCKDLWLGGTAQAKRACSFVRFWQPVRGTMGLRGVLKAAGASQWGAGSTEGGNLSWEAGKLRSPGGPPSLLPMGVCGSLAARKVVGDEGLPCPSRAPQPQPGILPPPHP